ncbi:acyl-CoA N-acyltransferase [Choiromyces venosus 120613-1]|uniref:Acyl-CoA N-acyltransferase n=1 Tax=Choiromyces venosus 120613-1 TaxID=1336337 RepID=A0A3N4K4B0_9PEZI|nr:acyl-CoA N-acyltransferase [Choiromyces venosus 120613-1]
MYLREARLSDMPAVGKIGARAFLDDPLFTAIEPGRHTYYEDYETGWVRRIRDKVLKPKTRIILAVDEETEQIAGFAIWAREGDDPAADRWKNEGWILKRLESTLLTLQETFTKTLSPPRKSRSEDSAALAHFGKAIEEIAATTWSREGWHIRWHLNFLGVDPSYHRRGVGGQLVNWGMQNGAKEGVICSLESSRAGRGLYEKLGFEVVDEWVPFRGFGKDGEFEGVTAPMMVWVPGRRGRANGVNGVVNGDGNAKGKEKKIGNGVVSANDARVSNS